MNDQSTNHQLVTWDLVLHWSLVPGHLLIARLRVPAPASRRGSCCAPAGRIRRGAGPSLRRGLSTPRTRRDAPSGSTGRCFAVGWRYWPSVRMSQPIETRSSSTASISCSSSPRPSIMPVLRDEALLLGDLQQLRASGCTSPAGGRRLYRRGTDSMLWLRMSGFCVEHELQRVPVAAEVGDEHLDARAGRLQADLADRLGPDGRAAVGQLVAVDAGDDDVAEVHHPHGVADADGLVEIERRRPAGGDVAEAAASACRRRRGSSASPCRRPSTRPCSGTWRTGRRCAGAGRSPASAARRSARRRASSS